MSNETTQNFDLRQEFPSDDWTMNVEATQGLEGHNHYHGDILHSGQFVCRIALSGCFADHAAAEAAMVARVRRWLIDFEGRPRPEEDGFQILLPSDLRA